MDIHYFLTPAEMRAWLEENHASATELHVGYYKKGAPVKGIVYQEALDEALCFGWIDGVTHRVDEQRYTQRFSPRRPGSVWSKVNIAKVEALIAQGRMTPAGMAAFEKRDPAKTAYVYETARALDADLEQRFATQSPEGWAFFQAQPPSYRLLVSRWIMSGKREETRLKRLAELIEISAQGRRREFV